MHAAKTRRIYTRLDARQAKIDANAKADAIHEAAEARRRFQQDTLSKYPSIGVVMREGDWMFYAFIAGQYVEHRDIATVAAKIEAA